MSDQPSTASDDKKKRQAYSAATTRLRKENPTLWNEVLADEYRKAGIEWKPRLTEEEKAKQQIAELLAAHPSLLSEFTESHTH